MAQNRSRSKGADTGGEHTTERNGSSRAPLFLALVLVLVGGISVGGYALWKNVSQPKEKEKTQVQKTPTYSDRVERILGDMTLEQKVGQLFIVTPESITDVDLVVAAGDATRDAILEYPIGGLCYFADNLQDPEQTAKMLRNVSNYAKDSCGILPFLCVDEEGGSVARVASNPQFGIEDVGSALSIGETGDVETARAAAEKTGTYLTDLGFNVDFAPVADIVEDEDNALYGRSFGSDPQLVADMVTAEIDGFSRAGILCAVKHFPGIGGAEGDSHNNRIYSDRTAEEMDDYELVPFKAALKAKVPMIMVGHLSCLELNRGEGDTPASLSKAVLNGLLRKRLGYTGIIVTDSMAMGAVDEYCEPSEQGVKAIDAGADIVLIPSNFKKAYRGLLKAIEDGTLSEERIDESVRRIIAAKIQLGA